jgi:LysM repeat protein
VIANQFSRLVAILVSALLVAIGFVALSAAPKAQAADASKFDPGLIISDSVFYDFGTMTANEIQRFLNSKLPTCNDNDGGPKCIKDYVADTPAVEGEDGWCDSVPAAQNQTAAQIIYTVAQACKINPRVLIVTLQKEQGLITLDNPTDNKYNKALGYKCPDTGPCDPKVGTFFWQLYRGAGQLQWYGDPRGSFTYLSVGSTKQISYQANNPGCGKKSVTIKSQATAALYYYTPYTPNDAAMANLYGTGDSCSAYGNRNFWRYFTDWFGDPIGGGFLLKSAQSQPYLIIEGKKYLVDNTDTVAAMKPLGPLGTVSQAYLDSFVDSGTVGRLIKSPALGNYYFVDGGQKFKFTNCAQAAVFGLDCNNAITLTQNQMNALPTATAMTEYVSGDEGQTFFIQDGAKRQILDADSLADSRIGVPALSAVKISAFKNLPWGKPIIRKGVSFTNLATGKLSLFDGTYYYDIDKGTAADIDFTKWFTKSSGSMLGEAIASVAAPVTIKSILNDAAGNQYLITNDGKRKVLDAKVISKNAPVVSDEFLALIPDAPTTVESTLVVKSAAAKNVYLVADGEKRLVLNTADVAKFAPVVKTTKAETLSNSAVAQIPSGHPVIAPGTYVRSSDSPKTYLIDGLKRALVVNDTDEATLLGLKNLRTIPAAQFKGYAKTSKITGIKFVCDANFYVAITGTLYPLSEIDASHYPGRGITLDKSTCAALTKSTVALGRFVRTADKAYYLIEDQTKKLIKTVASYEKLRGTSAKAALVGPYFLSRIPTGKAAGVSVSVDRFNVEPPIVLPEPSASPTVTPSPSPSATPSPSVSPTASPKPSISATPKATATPKPTATTKPKNYTVKSGDLLSKIAAKFGVTTTALMTANKITNANLIKVGQVLVIP